MKKTLVVTLSDEELLDLCRVIIDRDAEGAFQGRNQGLDHVRPEMGAAGLVVVNGGIYAD